VPPPHTLTTGTPLQLPSPSQKFWVSVRLSRAQLLMQTVLEGRLVQVPCEPASAQDWQGPVQAELQQNPCAQVSPPPH
jgi:hypothetical protein